MFKSKYPIFKCFQKHEKGFTLIELLVVIAILGVIAAVAIPNITQFMGSGKTEAAQAELHNVQVAASAASASGTVGTVNEITDSIISHNATGADDVGRYLLNDTTWKYNVDSTGAVTAGTGWGT